LIPIPVICEGIIDVLKNEETSTYRVFIISSPVDSFEIDASASYMPGLQDGYKKGDHVKVMAIINWNTEKNNWEDVIINENHLLFGIYEPEQMVDLKIKNPITDIPASRSFLDEKSGAGMVLTEGGSVIIGTGGRIATYYTPGGIGINENQHKTFAQNHLRIISDNKPYHLSREYFGMYKGSGITDKISKAANPTDININYRRFVQQSRSPDNWVSSCEGSWDPWVGANNDVTTFKKGREVIYWKAVNYGDNRVTTEIGEEGTGFFTFRVDKVMKSEGFSSTTSKAIPGVTGNVFNCRVSEEGEMVIEVGNQGLPTGNLPACKISVTKEGDVTVNSKNTITLTNGDNEQNSNSVVIDKIKGIDITATNGFRVNGKALATVDLVEFLKKHVADLVQVAAIGAPAPFSPPASADFVKGQTPGNFLTDNVGTPATGVIASTEEILKAVS